MLGTIIAIDAAAAILGRAAMEQSYVVRSLELIVIFPGIFATATIWLAMGYHWFGYNNGSFLSKAFWFCLFGLGPLAAVYYYFLSYRRNFAFNSSGTACESSNS